MVLLKYFSDTGNVMWTRQTGTAGMDYGYGVSASADGRFVYQTAYTSASYNKQPYTGVEHMILMQFASDGTLLWTRQSGIGSSRAYSVIASPDNKFIYQSGVTYGSLNGQPYAG